MSFDRNIYSSSKTASALSKFSHVSQPRSYKRRFQHQVFRATIVCDATNLSVLGAWCPPLFALSRKIVSSTNMPFVPWGTPAYPTSALQSFRLIATSLQPTVLTRCLALLLLLCHVQSSLLGYQSRVPSSQGTYCIMYRSRPTSAQFVVKALRHRTPP